MEDWSKKIDFSDILLLGYLCDNGEIAQCDCLRQKDFNYGDKTVRKIFLHFSTDAPHFGANYTWLEIPNERLCPPPKHRIQTYSPYSWSNERSYMSGSRSNGYRRSNYVGSYGDDQYETDLQQAVQDQTNTGSKQ